MRIAIPVNNNKLASHFGHCEFFKIIDSPFSEDSPSSSNSSVFFALGFSDTFWHILRLFCEFSTWSVFNGFDSFWIHASLWNFNQAWLQDSWLS